MSETDTVSDLRSGDRWTAMHLVVFALLMSAILVVVAANSLSWFSRQLLPVQCDVALPRWMLVAQDWDGGRCAHVLPSEEAYSGADWTPLCVGVCARPEE
jgi:hypothetical protein